jgi:hypothetical protein
MRKTGAPSVRANRRRACSSAKGGHARRMSAVTPETGRLPLFRTPDVGASLIAGNRLRSRARSLLWWPHGFLMRMSTVRGQGTRRRSRSTGRAFLWGPREWTPRDAKDNRGQQECSHEPEIFFGGHGVILDTRPPGSKTFVRHSRISI